MKKQSGSGFPRTVAVAFFCLTFALFFGPGLSAAEKESETTPPATETPGFGWISPLTQAAAQEKARAGAVPTTQTWHIFAAAGVSGYDLDGRLPGKFQEHTEVPREEVDRRWREMITCVRDPRGYAVWMVPVVSGRVP